MIYFLILSVYHGVLYIVYLLDGWQYSEDISWVIILKILQKLQILYLFEIEVVQLLIFLIFSLKRY